MSEYQLATYQTPRGPRAGIVTDGRIHDVEQATGIAAFVSVLGILEEWEQAEQLLRHGVQNPGPKVADLADSQLLPPLLYPGAIYCAGANYQDHMDAVAKHRGLPPQPSPKAVGVGPFFFLKAPRSVVAAGSDIDNESAALDFEIELAVVIGRKGRRVAAAEALDYVAGYTIANDLSARDRVFRPQLPDSSPFKFDWTSHKNFEGSCPLGPWIVPSSQVTSPQDLSLKTWVNGELRQDSNTREMIFSVAEQIEALSRFNTLYPGDIILTGTPAGVGAESGTWLKRGDVIRMQIAQIGELTSRIT